ncbi:MAG: hypothetical protein EPN89_11875 [Methylovulum sp.]|nr:MAG: hypothetical protein EPN89_11875 [Methylovulum sp.]
MAKRNWKRVHAGNLRHAMELCIEHAKDKHNRSLEQVSELMGMASKWTLYKWVECGGLPANMIKPFEMACGIDCVSRWLVTSNNKLVIEVPIGRKVKADDIHLLQETTNAAIGALIQFYKHPADMETTLSAIQQALESMVFHRGNVLKYQQPELFDEVIHD